MPSEPTSSTVEESQSTISIVLCFQQGTSASMFGDRCCNIVEEKYDGCFESIVPAQYVYAVLVNLVDVKQVEGPQNFPSPYEQSTDDGGGADDVERLDPSSPLMEKTMEEVHASYKQYIEDTQDLRPGDMLLSKKDYFQRKTKTKVAAIQDRLRKNPCATYPKLCEIRYSLAGEGSDWPSLQVKIEVDSGSDWQEYLEEERPETEPLELNRDTEEIVEPEPAPADSQVNNVDLQRTEVDPFLTEGTEDQECFYYPIQQELSFQLFRRVQMLLSRFP